MTFRILIGLAKYFSKCTEWRRVHTGSSKLITQSREKSKSARKNLRRPEMCVKYEYSLSRSSSYFASPLKNIMRNSTRWWWYVIKIAVSFQGNKSPTREIRRVITLLSASIKIRYMVSCDFWYTEETSVKYNPSFNKIIEFPMRYKR